MKNCEKSEQHFYLNVSSWIKIIHFVQQKRAHESIKFSEVARYDYKVVFQEGDAVLI